MSTLNVSNISDGTDTVATGYVVNGSAKAFFSSFEEGTVNKTLNISSGTDNGAGDGTYNFTSSFSDSQYAAVSGTAYRRKEYHDGVNTGSIRYITVDPNSSETNKVGYAENSGLSVAMFGDLA